MSRSVAIVGAGISGLATAYYLTRRAKAEGAPLDVVLLEADASAGGKIKSYVKVSPEGGSFVVDTGPHGFLDKGPQIFQLIDELALNSDLRVAQPSAARRYIVRGGRLRMAPEDPKAFLSSDILPFGAKLRLALEPLADGPPPGEESVWAFAARRVGAEAADILIDAMVSGIYAGDPKKLSLQAAFPRMAELEREHGSLVRAMLSIGKARRLARAEARADADAELSTAARLGAERRPFGGGPPGAPTGTLHSFRSGLGELTDALAATLDVRTGARVDRIDRLPDGRYRLRGSGEPVDAEQVILTVPADRAAALLQPHESTLARTLGEVPYASVAVVVHAYDKEALQDKRYLNMVGEIEGFGHLAPHCEGRRSLGAVWASSVFAEHAPWGKALFRTMIGGARSEALAMLPKSELIQIAHAELCELVGLNPEAIPEIAEVVRWPRGIPQYNLGHHARVAAADEIEARMPGVFVSGNGFRGVAMIDCIAQAARVAEAVFERRPVAGA